jgi:hypothetical protein
MKTLLYTIIFIAWLIITILYPAHLYNPDRWFLEALFLSQTVGAFIALLNSVLNE